MKKKEVLLTGATGNMGIEGLKQLLKHHDKYHVTVFSLSTKKDRKTLSKLQNNNNFSIIYGNLSNYGDVKKALTGIDIVLHVGALVSPMADSQPELAWKVNFGGTKNIVDAICENGMQDHIKLMYTGTVAETGNRPPPYHWGRIGDPLVPSVFDYYALSKIAAERYVVESGLKYWVSLRQTGILHENILKVNDGIAYHQPLNNHLEWITAHDSGKILLNICSEEIPEEFWCRVYNIGGGEKGRLTAFQFMDKIYRILGVDLRNFEEPNHFALQNFHGQYYYDSDILEDYLHFRTEGIDKVVDRIKKKRPLKLKLLKYLPSNVIKKSIVKQALKGDTPLRWLKNNDQEKINAFFGSIENWHKIKGWDEFKPISNPPHKKLNHGFDESKTDTELNMQDIMDAAKFRGGKCISKEMKNGDIRKKLNWKCSHGHEFEASPYLVLKTGHWCPECMKTPWNFDEQAKHNPFLGPSDWRNRNGSIYGNGRYVNIV